MSADILLRGLCLAAVLVGGGCASISGPSDGPGQPIDPASIADAVPQVEPITRAGNYTPYTVFGQTYHLLPTAEGYRSSGTASWYGSKFHGRLTSNGEVYDMYQMTAAHKTLPIPSYVRVTNRDNGQSAIVRINDRGPFHGDRIIDLSWAAATKLGYQQHGTAAVTLEVVDPAAWQLGQSQATPPAAAVAAALLPGDYLQVGAFSEPDLAHLMLIELIEKVPYALQVHLDAGRYKVLVGPLIDQTVLDGARKRLAAVSIDAFKFANQNSCAVSKPELKC